VSVLNEGLSKEEEEEEGTVVYETKQNRYSLIISLEREREREREIRRCSARTHRERERERECVKRKGTTEMDGDERNDKVGGRIYLFIWVPPFILFFKKIQNYHT
jgi:hypothetical protein